MNKLKTVHVELTERQTHIINETRNVMFPYTDAELADLIVGMGILALDRKYADESEESCDNGLALEESELTPRHVAEQVTVHLPEETRQRLEKFLARCQMSDSDAVCHLIDLGMETLQELRIIRERDLLLTADEGVTA